MADAHDALLRGLKARFGKFHDLEVRESRSQRWHSATFSGSRHSFALTLSGPAADTVAACFAASLDAMEFVLPGHLVADIAIADRVDSPSCSTFTVEALTVEDV